MASDGIISVTALLLFGFTLWSTFAVTVAMGQEMMPRNIGFASGLVLGLAVGGGGIGVAITGALADISSLSAALSTLPLIGAIGCFALLPYPWKVLQTREKAVIHCSKEHIFPGCSLNAPIRKRRWHALSVHPM